MVLVVLMVAGVACRPADVRDLPPPPATTPAELQSGKTLFDGRCGQCHGDAARGTDQGPPLVHRIYHPGHHGDGAFRLAPKRGVRQHHWPFGDMQPVPDVTDDDMTAIIFYIRELQYINGIITRPPRMEKRPVIAK